MAQDMSFDMSWALVFVVSVGHGGGWWLSFIDGSDVLAPAWPESPGFGLA